MIGGVDGTLKMWDLDSGRLLKEFKGHTDSITSVVMNSCETK